MFTTNGKYVELEGLLHDIHVLYNSFESISVHFVHLKNVSADFFFSQRQLFCAVTLLIQTEYFATLFNKMFIPKINNAKIQFLNSMNNFFIFIFVKTL